MRASDAWVEFVWKARVEEGMRSMCRCMWSEALTRDQGKRREPVAGVFGRRCGKGERLRDIV
jgi:hypothetical protein